MSLDADKLKTFLAYKESKLKSIYELESKRLEELKHARDTIFKYALPATIIDAAAGSFGTLLADNVLILLPVALFVILIYFLAEGLDRKKYAERIEIIEYTESSMWEIREQEIILLQRS